QFSCGRLPWWFCLMMWFAYLLQKRVCICTHWVLRFVGWLFRGHRDLFVQSQRCGFQIGEDGGPALFTENFDHGTLSGFPGRRQFLNLFSAFGCDREFHTIAASASDDLHETVPLQRPKISHERRAIHPQPIALLSHVSIILGLY